MGMLASGGSAYVWWFGVIRTAPVAGMLFVPLSSSPKYRRARAIMAGREKSRTGVRTPLRDTKTGPGFPRPRKEGSPPGFYLAAVSAGAAPLTDSAFHPF